MYCCQSNKSIPCAFLVKGIQAPLGSSQGQCRLLRHLNPPKCCLSMCTAKVYGEQVHPSPFYLMECVMCILPCHLNPPPPTMTGFALLLSEINGSSVGWRFSMHCLLFAKRSSSEHGGCTLCHLYARKGSRLRLTSLCPFGAL